VAEIYSFDLLAAALLVWMGLSPYGLIVSPSLMGIILGVRPSTGLFLFPLYIYFWQYHFRNKNISLRATLFFHAPAVIIVLTWLAPLLIKSGGFEGYLALYRTHNPVEKISVLQSIYRFSSYIITIVPTVLIFFIASIIKKSKREELQDILNRDASHQQLNILNVWIWPALIFFLLVHYSKGYLLINIIPIFMLCLFVLKDIRLRKIFMAIICSIQIIYFCFIPYHKPDPDIYLAPAKRNINIIGVWYERTRSEYQMSRSHIVALQNCHDFIAEVAESVVLLVGDKKYLFIDPTVRVSPRALQAHYPKIEITKYLPLLSDQYGYHHDRIQEARTDIHSMLAEAMIISRVDFIEKYLTDINIEFYKKDNNWGAFFVSGEDAAELKERYHQLFAR
jgi:hypothetical protein